jgi:hypothetical protein
MRFPRLGFVSLDDEMPPTRPEPQLKLDVLPMHDAST